MFLMICWNYMNKVIFLFFMYLIFQGDFVENFIVKKVFNINKKIKIVIFVICYYYVVLRF